MKSNCPLSRKNDIVVQETDGEVLIYDLSKNKAFCLNETSALVWQMCDGNTSVNEISKNLSNKFNSNVSEDLVWLAIDELKREKLIANDDELESNIFDGMSRRDVIKKIGLSTMMALPIITVLTVPTVAQTASTCIPNRVGQSQSNVCTCNAGTPIGSDCGSGSPNGGLPACNDTRCRCVVRAIVNAGTANEYGRGNCIA